MSERIGGVISYLDKGAAITVAGAVATGVSGVVAKETGSEIAVDFVYFSAVVTIVGALTHFGETAVDRINELRGH